MFRYLYFGSYSLAILEGRGLPILASAGSLAHLAGLVLAAGVSHGCLEVDFHT